MQIGPFLSLFAASYRLIVSSPSSSPKKQTVSVWVKLFVVFHITAITLFALPNPPAAIREHRVEPGGTEWLLYWNDAYVKPFPLISGYLKVSGFWQYWDMFAPNPSHTDTWGDALVEYRNGAKKRYAYPRMFNLPLYEKFLQERYRKFYERAGSDKYPYLFPQFGLRIALLMDDPSNPPVKVTSYSHTKEIAEPGKRQEQNYTEHLVFTYIVDQKDLARMRSIK